jgi:cation diffusion facilitator CzcD-associated flavoprotein CzcO
VVGAGQAGVAMSEHLTRHGIPHLVLEKSALPRPGAAAAGIRWWPTARPGTIGFPAWCSRTARRQLCRQRAGRRLFCRLCPQLQCADPYRR